MVGQNVEFPHLIFPIDLIYYLLRISKDFHVYDPHCQCDFLFHDYRLILRDIIRAILCYGERMGTKSPWGDMKRMPTPDALVPYFVV